MIIIILILYSYFIFAYCIAVMTALLSISSGSTHLKSILKSTCQEEESCCMLKPLFAQECKGILEGSLPPALLCKVVGEEVGHAAVINGAEESPHQVFLLHGKVVNGCIQWVIM